MALTDQVNYCPCCGTAVLLQLRFGRERPVCPACDWVYFPDPKVAAAMLIEHNDQVLLVRRAIDPMRGHWSLPAGFVDAGEDPQQAVIRECWEETGLQVHVDGLLDVIFGQEHPRGAHIVIFYRGHVMAGEIQAGDDVDAAAFFSRDELPSLAFASTRKILQQSA